MWSLVAALAFFCLASVRPAHGQQILPCHAARLKCLYREGCRKALENYLVGCRDVVSGDSPTCSDFCIKSLIALTSTPQGYALMECDCGGDVYCNSSKNRLDPCRPAVQHANRNGTTVTCEVAQWICSADNQCSTALGYYFRNCRAMFDGRRCTHHCNNSISILQRQQRATKLRTCVCQPDPRSEFSCHTVKANMERFCFLRPQPTDWLTNQLSGSGDVRASVVKLTQLVLVGGLLFRWT